jgi:hypothetical protein
MSNPVELLESGAGRQAMGGYSVAKWLGRLLRVGGGGGKKRVGSRHTGKRSSRVRDKIARVEASLSYLDSLREDRSVLVFDWDNCASVEHESLRNSFRNTLLDDISDHHSTVDPLSFQGFRARIKAQVRRNTTDKRSRRVEKWLDDVPAPPQFHGSLTPPYSSSDRTGSSVDGKAARHVGLLIWPPEIIARDAPSCYEDGVQHRKPADSSAHGNHLARQLQANASCGNSPHHGGTSMERGSSATVSADSPLDGRGVSVAELLLESRTAKDHSVATMALPLRGRGMLHHPGAFPRVTRGNASGWPRHHTFSPDGSDDA